MREYSLVVRLVPDNRPRPIQLLGEDESSDFVRQRPWRKGKPSRRRSPYRLSESVRTSNHERNVLRLLASTLQPLRKLLRGHCGAAEVARDDVRCVRQRRRQTLGLSRAHLLWREGATSFLAD